MSRKHSLSYLIRRSFTYYSLVDGVGLSCRRPARIHFFPRFVYQAAAIDHSEQLAARVSSARITQHGPLSIGRISSRRTEDGRLSLAETTRERRRVRATDTQTHTRAHSRRRRRRARPYRRRAYSRVYRTRTTAHSIHVPPWGIRDRPRHRRVESPSAGESSAARRRNCESGGARARARPRFEIRERRTKLCQSRSTTRPTYRYR